LDRMRRRCINLSGFPRHATDYIHGRGGQP
jgi:hypothetical protein